MSDQTFDALLEAVNALPDQMACLAFRGPSASAAAVRKEVDAVRETLARPNGSGIGVAFLHPPTPEDFGRTLLEACGVSPAGIQELRSNASMHSAGELFGRYYERGVFEEGRAGGLGLVGVHTLPPDQVGRLVGHLAAWWRTRPTTAEPMPHLFLTGEYDSAFARGATDAGLHVVTLASLADRREDFPFALHDTAARFGCSLADFHPESYALLAAHAWSGDLLELARMIDWLLRNRSPADGIVRRDHVREALAVPFAPTRVRDAAEFWIGVLDTFARCDKLATDLVGGPFFPAVADDVGPFNDPSPRGQFFAIITWFYRRYEGMRASFNFLLGFCRTLGIDPVQSQLKRTRDTFNGLRQHFQHHRPLGGSGSKEVCCWLTQACGQGLPTGWKFEPCVRELLVELERFGASVERTLELMRDDANRTSFVIQWKDALTVWTPQECREFIAKWLKNAGWRANVNTRPLIDRWLEDFRTRLRELANRTDKERDQALTRWLAERQASDPEGRPLVTGRDLMNLGVTESERNPLLERLQAAQLKGRLPRESLLSIAQETINILARTPPPIDQRADPS